MQHVTIRAALAAPLALLLGAATATAQRAAPVPEDDPTGVERANQTRELEGEIEEYPARPEDTRNPADPAWRIPEEVQPAPSKAPTPPRRAPVTWGTSSPERSSTIDPGEVQRVFGSDMRLIAIESLDRPAVTRMQQRLQALGHYHGRLDGIAGPQTRAALTAYSRAQQAMKQRLIENNQLTTDLAEQLGVEPSTSPSVPRPRSVPPSPPPLGPEQGSPLTPPGSAPLPPPGMPLPTPSGAPPARGVPPAPAGGVTPSAPPPPLP